MHHFIYFKANTDVGNVCLLRLRPKEIVASRRRCDRGPFAQQWCRSARNFKQRRCGCRRSHWLVLVAEESCKVVGCMFGSQSLITSWSALSSLFTCPCLPRSYPVNTWRSLFDSYNECVVCDFNIKSCLLTSVCSSFSCPWPTVSCSVPCIKPRRCGHGSLSHLDYRQCWLSSCIMMVRFSFTRSSTCKSLSVMRSEHSRDVIRAAVKVSNDNLLHARLVTTRSLTLDFFMHSLKQIRTRSAIMSPTIGNLRVAAGITRFNVTNYGLHMRYS